MFIPFPFSSSMGKSSKLQESSSCGDGREFRIRFAAANAAAISVKKKLCEFKLKARELGVNTLGPKLNDCPALVLPCTTARYTTTKACVRNYFPLWGDNIIR
jgi:hypothetical protein